MVEPEAGKQEARLLLVDDSDQLLSSMTRLFGLRGIVARGANSSEQALAILSDEEIDLALVDYSLGDIDGIELSKQMLSVRPQLQCHIFTGAASEATVSAVKEAGLAGIVLKPASIDALIERLQLNKPKN